MSHTSAVCTCPDAQLSDRSVKMLTIHLLSLFKMLHFTYNLPGHL